MAHTQPGTSEVGSPRGEVWGQDAAGLFLIPSSGAVGFLVLDSRQQQQLRVDTYVLNLVSTLGLA